VPLFKHNDVDTNFCELGAQTCAELSYRVLALIVAFGIVASP